MNSHKPENPFGLWLRIFRRTLHWWIWLIIAVFAMICFALANLAMVYLVGPALITLFEPENATLSGQLGSLAGSNAIKAKFETLIAPVIFADTPIDTLERFCLILLIVVFAKNLFRYIQEITAQELLQNVTNDFRKRAFSKLLILPLAFFHRNKAGDLISRIVSDVRVMQESVSVTIADMFRDPLQILAYYLFLLAIDYKLTLLLTLIFPLVVFVMSVIGRHLRRYSKRIQQKMGELASVIQEDILGIRVVKAFNAEEHEKHRFNTITDRYLRNFLKMYRIFRLSGPFNEGLGVILAVLILWFGGRTVLQGNGLKPAEFMQYIIVLLLMMQPIKAFADKLNRIQQGLAAAERVFWLLDHRSDIINKPGAAKIAQLENEIQYNNVSFKYEGAEDFAITNLSLTVHRGEVIALVGHSGGGKSTAADLLARFYDPTEGSILIDGTDLRDLDITSWRSRLGTVTQEVILFNNSVSANIAYAKTEGDISRIASAAQAANAMQFIDKLPQKFDTIIGDRGVKLSGGERQRIAIARAIYRNPEILIFDEATSALDSRAEKLVQQAIDRLVEGRTVLVIAHRLSTVMQAHRIIVLERGRKICEGTHEQLLDSCEIYRHLYEMQFNV